jgi:hypothetical protein
MGSTRRRYAGLSLILDDSRLTEAAQRDPAFPLGWPPTAADQGFRISCYEIRTDTEIAVPTCAQVRVG